MTPKRFADKPRLFRRRLLVLHLSGEGQCKQDINETRSLHQFLWQSESAKATFPRPGLTNSRSTRVYFCQIPNFSGFSGTHGQIPL